MSQMASEISTIQKPDILELKRMISGRVQNGVKMFETFQKASFDDLIRRWAI